MKQLLRLFCLLLLSATAMHGMESNAGKGKERAIAKKAAGKATDKEIKELEARTRAMTLNANAASSSSQVAAAFPKYIFTPGIENVLIKLIQDEKQGITGAQYRFTLYSVAMAIKKQKEAKKINVVLVVDKGFVDEYCHALHLLITSGIPVYCAGDLPNKAKGNFSIMHHKFFIFQKNSNDKKLLFHATYNATGQAERNWENATIDDHPEATAVFEKRYEELLKHCLHSISKDDCQRADQNRLAKKRESDFAKTVINQIPKDYKLN